MSIGHDWATAHPAYAVYMRRADKARAEAVRRAVRFLAAPVRRVTDRIARSARRRAVERELSELSDDILSDIGLTRADIADVGRTVSSGRRDPTSGTWTSRLAPPSPVEAGTVPAATGLPPARRVRRRVRAAVRPPVTVPEEPSRGADSA